MSTLASSLRDPATTHFQGLRQEFAETGVITVKHFFPPQLYDKVCQALAQAQFERSTYRVDHLGQQSLVDEMVTFDPWFDRLTLLLNSADLIGALRSLTRIPDLGRYSGRIYKMLPHSAQQLEWHSDHNHGKRLAISVNVSPRAFEGGELEYRHILSQKTQRLHNTGPGDAVIFRIDGDHEHRVLPVSGTEPKCAVTGWYFDGPTSADGGA